MELINHKCIIVSAGDFQPVDLNRTDGDFLIACDAGFSYLENMGILPDLIVGDFDSLYEIGPQYEEMLEEIRKQNPESVLQLDVHKDDTDTMKAVRIGLEKGYRRFYLYGALGGKRLDHTLANMQTLLFIKHHGYKVQTVPDAINIILYSGHQFAGICFVKIVSRKPLYMVKQMKTHGCRSCRISGAYQNYEINCGR